MQGHSEIQRFVDQLPWMTRLARQIVGPLEADDVVQDTLIAAMKSPPDGRPVRPWLSRVMRNVARSRWRSQKRRVDREHEATAYDPDHAVQKPDVAQAARVLATAVDGLAEPYRSCVLDIYVHELSASEIASRDSVPAATIRWRHRKALAVLRSSIENRHDPIGNGRDGRNQAGGKDALAALMPLVKLPEVNAATAATAGTIAGGMMLKWVLATAAAVAFVVGIVATRSSSDDHNDNGDVTSASVRSKQSLVTTATTGSIDVEVAAAGDAVLTNAAVELVRDREGGVAAVLQRTRGDQVHFDTVPPGRYCVVVRAGDHAGSRCKISVQRDQRTRVRIQLVSAKAQIAGTVRDALGGFVGGATVRLAHSRRRNAVWFASTDDGGRFSVAIPSGSYRAHVRADGYSDRTRLIVANATRSIDFVLNPAAEVEGVVLSGGIPVAGATVVINSSDVTGVRKLRADSRGQFASRDLPSGQYQVRAFNQRCHGQAQVALLAGDTRRIEVPFVRGNTVLTGTVREFTSDVGVAGVTVRLVEPVARSVQADDHGRFRFEGLALGAYKIEVDSGSHQRLHKRVLLGAEDVDVALVVVRGGRVDGIVRDPNGAPLSDVHIVVAESGDSRLEDIRSDDKGHFRLSPTPAGHIRVVGYHADYGLTKVVPLDVAGGTAHAIELAFAQGARIRGRVIREGGGAAGQVTVSVSASMGPAWSIATDADGRFTLASLAHGSYTLRAHGAAIAAGSERMHPKSWKSVVVARDSDVEVTLELPGGNLTINGQVSVVGKPVVGAAVWAERQNPGWLISGGLLSSVREFSGDAGSFRLDGLPAGEFDVYAWHPDHGQGKVASVRGSAPITIELQPKASLRGHIAAGADGPFRLSLSCTRRVGSAGGKSIYTESWVADSPQFHRGGLDPSPQCELHLEGPDGLSGEVGAFRLASGQTAQVEIPVSQFGTVVGNVVDAQTGKPIAGATISLGRHSAPIYPDGSFRMPALPGSYDGYKFGRGLYVERRGTGYPIDIAFEVASGETVELGTIKSHNIIEVSP